MFNSIVWKKKIGSSLCTFFQIIFPVELFDSKNRSTENFSSTLFLCGLHTKNSNKFPCLSDSNHQHSNSSHIGGNETQRIREMKKTDRNRKQEKWCHSVPWNDWVEKYSRMEHSKLVDYASFCIEKVLFSSQKRKSKKTKLLLTETLFLGFFVCSIFFDWSHFLSFRKNTNNLRFPGFQGDPWNYTLLVFLLRKVWFTFLTIHTFPRVLLFRIFNRVECSEGKK